MIEVHDLTKAFRGRRALRGVSFELGSGVTGLLGPNGAGKTTLLRCMLGIIKPNGGRASFGDGAQDVRSSVGYLPQRYGLLKELRVSEGLRYFAALKRIPQQDVEEQIAKALRMVNLSEAQSERAGALSGGMLRRVGIAAALLGDPEVLVFDEPTAGLDPEERVRFKRLVASLAESRTILISTHIVEDIEALAGRVVVLDGGLVRATGTLEQIAEHARGKSFVVPRSLVNEYSEEYYVDRLFEADGRTLARVLSMRQLEGFEPVEPTVEDGYLCLTRGLV